MCMSHEQQKRGRPRKSAELLYRTFNLRLPPSLIAEIEAYHRRRNPEIDMSDTLRDLIRRGLADAGYSTERGR